MFTNQYENKILRDWWLEDRSEPGTKVEAINFTPDVITDLLRYGHARFTDNDKKRWLQMTIKGRRFIHDYLVVYDLIDDEELAHA